MSLPVVFLLVPLFLTAPVWAESRADLLGVYQAAVANDPQLAAARHAYQAQREALPQARAGLLPTLSAGATAETTHLSREEPGLARERSGSTVRANLNQPLFRLDRWYGLQAARQTVAQAEAELAVQEQALVYRSAEAYFETLRQLDTLAAAQAEEKALLRQRDQAQGRLDDGAASITDVLDAQAAYDVALANRQLAQRRVEDAYEALLRLTGTSYEGIAGISHRLPVEPPMPNDAKAWVEAAVRQNLQLQASQFAVEVAQNTVRQRQAGHAPTLDAVASYRKGDNDSFGYSNPADFGGNGYRGNVTQSSIGLELSIPLYSGGQVSSQVRESTERLYQRQDEADDKRRETVLTTRNAYRAINTDIEQIRARLQSIASGQKALEANQVGLEVGTRNIADVLNAQRQLYAAVRDYNNARYDYILNTLKLKQAVGTLFPGDLQALAMFLKANYVTEQDFLPSPIP